MVQVVSCCLSPMMSRYAPDDEEERTEAELASDLEAHATYWDNFLAYCQAVQAPWDASDTDAYREIRAVEAFNLGCLCANDLITFIPTLRSWVPHIEALVVPRQILRLGDPSRRSCEACESFGAVCKAIIKNTTCKRAITTKFTKGYVQQCFERVSAREQLLNGPTNAPYMQREDARAVPRAPGGRMLGRQPACLLTRPQRPAFWP